VTNSGVLGTILVERGSIWRRLFLPEPVTASELQKAGLARILQSRYHKLSVGELYRVGGRPLNEPTEAITLDTGMVLIGLSERLRSSSEAEKALRDILMLFFAALGISREVCRKINRAELDLRRQLKMLSVWTQNRQNAPLMPVLNFAAGLLSRIDPELHQTGHQTIARTARALLPDAWAIYSKTVSFFGYAVDEPRIPHVLDRSGRSPSQVAREDEPVREHLLSA
jgi:hypothetical protein